MYINKIVQWQYLGLILIAIFFALFFYFISYFSAAAASTHHYVCGDFTVSAGTPTCSSDTWTFSDTEIQTVIDSTHVFDLNNKTWYVSWTQTGGQELRYLCDNYPTTCSFAGHTATFADEAWVITNGGSPTGL